MAGSLTLPCLLPAGYTVALDARVMQVRRLLGLEDTEHGVTFRACL